MIGNGCDLSDRDDNEGNFKQWFKVIKENMAILGNAKQVANKDKTDDVFLNNYTIV